MKKIFLVSQLILAAITLQSQTVALHSVTGVQLFSGSNGLVDAYNVAEAGDTIYLPGGGFTTPQIDKKLTIYGAGHYVDSTKATGKTILNGHLTLRENADGFHLEGVEIAGNVNFYTNESVNNVLFSYCMITGQFNVSGNLSNPTNNLLILRSVVLGVMNFDNAENAAIFNSIIQNRINNANGMHFENNILFYSYGGSLSYRTINGNNNMIRNNIFFIENKGGANGTANQLYNNLFTIEFPTFGSSATTSGNYYPVDQALLFMNQQGFNFDYAHDYYLQTPESYSGTDGTEVGIFGGAFPYKEGAVPSNPHIQMKNIAPTTNPDGSLQIQISVEAQIE